MFIRSSVCPENYYLFTTEDWLSIEGGSIYFMNFPHSIEDYLKWPTHMEACRGLNLEKCVWWNMGVEWSRESEEIVPQNLSFKKSQHNFFQRI